jgi:acyl-coenzyme A synthetase/AMP-(fatty) acid ligase
VPTLFAAMLQESPCTLDSIRLGVSAAEPLPAEICRRWHQRFGFPVLDGIGSTEVLHIYISSRPDKIKPGSSGLPVPGYEIRVTDEKGRDLPAGAVGDLWVRGPSTATCYWNRPEITAERMRDGWFFTGDKYSVDEDGYYWYAGRSDDMFRVGGEWVSPVEVEAALMEHPAVLECAVVPQQDSASLLKPKAYVILKPGWTPGPELTQQMRDFVKQRIAPYKYPRVIEFLEELPKTATGKIQRYRLRG